MELEGEGLAHLDAQVGVHQDLNVKGHVALVGDDDGGGEGLAVEGDAVDSAKLIGPEGAGLFVDALGGETKVELDAIGGRLRRRLAEELPAGDAGEAVLGELAELGVVGRGSEDLVGGRKMSSQRCVLERRAEGEWEMGEVSAHGEDEGNATADGLGSVEGGSLAEPEAFGTSGVLPAQDGCAVQQDLDALAGGQAGSDAGVVVGDVDLGLGRQAGGGGQSRGLVRAVDHCEGMEMAWEQSSRVESSRDVWEGKVRERRAAQLAKSGCGCSWRGGLTVGVCCGV